MPDLRRLITAALLALAPLPAAAAPRADMADEVIYHVFTRSFRDSDGDRIGDLNGIAAGIPYLRQLGVTTLLLTPLYPSRTYHNYFATDFEGIEPKYGTMADFRHLVAALHRAHIKIVLDMEFQYVTDGHPWWKAALADPQSAAGDRILWQDRAKGVPEDGPFGLRTFDHFGHDPQKVTTVALKSDAVRQWADRYLRRWVDLAGDGRCIDGVDGFRLDHMMDDLDRRPALTDLFTVFWKPAFERLRAINPRLMFIAEQAEWADLGTDYFTRAGVSAVFAFHLQGAIRKLDKTALAEAITATARATPPGSHQVVFAENHDLPRTASDPGMTGERLRSVAALVLLLQGTPSIYYGQELGMKGARNPAYKTDEAEIPQREAFKWAATDAAPGQATWYRRPGEAYWDQRQARDHDGISVAEEAGKPGSLLTRYRHLAALRHAHPALRHGDEQVLPSPANLLVVRRTLGAETLYIVSNLSPTPARYTGPGAHSPDLIGGGGAALRPWQTALFRVARRRPA